MPIDQSNLPVSGAGGYASICETATKATWALYPGDDDCNPKIENGFPTGSAFAVSPEGLFLTATHVIEDIREAFEDEEFRLCIVRDPTHFGHGGPHIVNVNVEKEYSKGIQDVTVLSTDADVSEIDTFEHLEVRTQPPLSAMGQPVAAFGYPLNDVDSDDGWDLLVRTFSGVVSQLVVDFGPHPYYEVDAIFNPGLSGGPLISLSQGDVIGVVKAFDWHVQEVDLPHRSVQVPYPTNISQASVITDCDHPDVTTDIGQELENLGIDSSS